MASHKSIPVIIAVRRSLTDNKRIPWHNPYRLAGLYVSKTLDSYPETPSALLKTALSVLPSGRQIIALYPDAAYPAWWQVATPDGNKELSEWTPATWKQFSANHGIKGWKLFLLPSVNLQFPLPEPPPAVMHPRVQEALGRAHYMPANDLISHLGHENMHVAVSMYLGTPTCVLTLAPIFSLLLTAATRPESGPSFVIVTPSPELAQHIGELVREFLSSTIANGEVIIGDCEADAMIAVIDATSVTSPLRCGQVALLDFATPGMCDVNVAEEVVVTRMTSTGMEGWTLRDAATLQAEIMSMLATGSIVESVLEACSNLPEGVVIIVGSQVMVDAMADEDSVWIVCEGEGLPDESVRMLLCTDLKLLQGFFMSVVGGIVVDDKTDGVVVGLLAEMVGKMGTVIDLAHGGEVLGHN